MLSINEKNNLKDLFRDIYKKETSLTLLSLLNEADRYLNKESSVVRSLAFCNDNWKFRAELKLRREAILAEIRRR
jgi:hypothetical protein